ncbi:Uncharacterized membrane-anchored protein [Nonomuraea maritima]|uniref:Uncharacterized membrane-anchored protein n=1 Tax=Nonomuraea maritima TaxID=683260 RepID=A0A1G8SMM0_9ACTN|nr:hypothetical protein [Nonomuraea maritima]SDJ30457.1 Uncharacterized membrane-anchored protein [Nonomuraea maritima]
MTELDQKYRNELMLALRLHDISGERVGEVLAEVESHVQETGEDPRAAFGSPKEYAAKVVAQLDTRSGKPAPVPDTLGKLAVGVLSFTGTMALIRGLLSDGAVPVTVVDVVTAVAFVLLMTATVFLIFRATTAVAGAGTYRVLAVILAVTAIAALVIGMALKDDVSPLAEMPPALVIGYGVAALAGGVALVVRAIRRGWIVSPR